MTDHRPSRPDLDWDAAETTAARVAVLGERLTEHIGAGAAWQERVEKKLDKLLETHNFVQTLRWALPLTGAFVIAWTGGIVVLVTHWR